MKKSVTPILCILITLYCPFVCCQGLSQADPEEELIGVFLIQILPESLLPYRDLFIPVVYRVNVD